MITRAIQRNVRVSAKKATLVCRLIRNQSVTKASQILANQDQKTAKFLLQLLNAAAANAVNNHAMAGDKLYVFRSSADQAPSIKRSSYRAKGRTDMITKRRSHLSVYLSDDPQENEKLNKVLLKPRAHQHKYKDKNLAEATKLKPKKIYRTKEKSNKK